MDSDSVLNLDNVASLRETLSKLAIDIKNSTDSKDTKKDILENYIGKWEGYSEAKEWGFLFYNHKEASSVSNKKDKQKSQQH